MMKKIILKTASVDEEIAPLLVWINKLPGTLTDFSCAGHEKNDFKPYVSLHCWNHSSLFYIMNFISPYCENCISDFGERNLMGEVDSGQIRFSFYFKDKDSLEKCISKLPKIKLSIYGGGT